MLFLLTAQDFFQAFPLSEGNKGFNWRHFPAALKLSLMRDIFEGVEIVSLSADCIYIAVGL